MYCYRVMKITPIYRDPICGLGIIGREARPFYSYINKGSKYLTLNLKHAVRNATVIAVQEGLASWIKH